MKEKSLLNSNLVYDVIIIGAGIGGLLAGNILQKKGYNVLIFERNNYPGGYCTSFRRKNFNFDANLHWTFGFEKGGTIYNILKKFNGENCVDLIKLEELYYWKDQQNNINFHVSMSLPEYIETLVRNFPEEEAEIRRFFKLYGNLFDPNTIKKLANKKVSDIITPHFSNPILINTILAPLGLFGWPPKELSAFFFLAFSMSHFFRGTYYIKGGAGNFSKGLADIFINNKGVINYETEVVNLMFEGKKVFGVVAEDRDKNKKKYYSHIIIANINPLILVSNLSSESKFPNDYVENIKKREPSLSAVNLYIGLDIDIKDYNISDYMIWTPLNRDNSIDDLKKSLEIADYSKLPIGSISIHSNIDSTCCPEGKSVISILCYAKYDTFDKFLDLKNKINNDYISIKQKITEQLIEAVSKVLEIPNLKKHIEVMELATPITFRNYSNNPTGAIMGWKMTPLQFILNPLSQKTPIDNLFLCGQWASPSGGLPSVAISADAVSELAMDYLKNETT